MPDQAAPSPETENVRHTLTLEVELELDVPAGARWSQDLKDDIEAWIDAELLGRADGREITTRAGARLRVNGHSVVVIPAAWPYR
jgi:hypothetical protein